MKKPKKLKLKISINRCQLLISPKKSPSFSSPTKVNILPQIYNLSKVAYIASQDSRFKLKQLIRSELEDRFSKTRTIKLKSLIKMETKLLWGHPSQKKKLGYLSIIMFLLKLSNKKLSPWAPSSLKTLKKKCQMFQKKLCLRLINMGKY